MMSRIVVYVCDVCGGEHAESFTIKRKGKQVTKDLCPEHAGPLLELLKNSKTTSSKPRSSGRTHRPKGGGIEVTPMSEVKGKVQFTSP